MELFLRIHAFGYLANNHIINGLPILVNYSKIQEKRRNLKTKETDNQQADISVEEIVDNLTLFDDDLMSIVFDANIPATELMLKIILERNDIKVISVVGQKELKNPIVGGRNLRLDILAKDGQGEHFNVEVQRKNSGADERRARFHSSMIDSRMLKKKQDFKDLKDSYMIMITQNDYFGNGLPIYTVNRHIEELDTRFKDGAHIVYVNGSYRGNDPIGRLMHDFNCKKSKHMYHKELADGVKHFKEEGGRSVVCEAVEEYAKRKAEEAAEAAAKTAAVKATVEDAVSYRMDKKMIINRLNEKYGITKEEAEKVYDFYAKQTV